MPTKNPRINITFEETTAGLLASMAKQEHKSISSFAKELILEALERREDKILSLLADSRDQDIENIETLEHDDFWK